MIQYSKYTKLLFLTAIISVSLATYCLFRSSQKSSLNANETAFMVSDSTTITNIFIEKGNKKLNLRLDNSQHWKITDTVSADLYLMQNMLDFLTKTVVRKPIATNIETAIKKKIC